MRWATLDWRSKDRQRVWSVDLVEHDTIADLRRDQKCGEDIVAMFRHTKGRGKEFGTIHIAADRADPADVFHEAVHLAARHAHMIRRVPVNPRTEEAIARALDGALALILDFYGYEIRKKEKS